jgi:hypothetical protein
MAALASAISLASSPLAGSASKLKNLEKKEAAIVLQIEQTKDQITPERPELDVKVETLKREQKQVVHEEKKIDHEMNAVKELEVSLEILETELQKHEEKKFIEFVIGRSGEFHDRQQQAFKEIESLKEEEETADSERLVEIKTRLGEINEIALQDILSLRRMSKSLHSMAATVSGSLADAEALSEDISSPEYGAFLSRIKQVIEEAKQLEEDLHQIIESLDEMDHWMRWAYIKSS